MFTYIWLTFMVNVRTCTIHGSYRYMWETRKLQISRINDATLEADLLSNLGVEK